MIAAHRDDMADQSDNASAGASGRRDRRHPCIFHTGAADVERTELGIKQRNGFCEALRAAVGDGFGAYCHGLVRALQKALGRGARRA